MAVMFYIPHFDDFAMLTRSWTLSWRFVNEMSCYCPGGCRGNIPYLSAYRGWQLPVYGCLWSSATCISEDGRPKIVDPPLRLIIQKGQGGCCSLCIVEGGWYLICDCQQPIACQITQDARPKIIDAQLTLIFRMRQGVCRYNSYL